MLMLIWLPAIVNSLVFGPDKRALYVIIYSDKYIILAVFGRYQWFGVKLSQIMTWISVNLITRVKGQPVFMRWIGRLPVDLSTIVKLGVKRHFRL